MSKNTETLLAVAAELRTIGCTWTQIADKVNRKPATCQSWPSRYKQQWNQIYREAQQKRFDETNGEAHLVLKNMLRSLSDSTRLKAVDMWLKNGAAAYGQRSAGKGRADEREPDEFDEYVAREAEDLRTQRARMDRVNAKRGLPRFTDAEFHAAYDAELRRVYEPQPRTTPGPAPPAPVTPPTAGPVAWALIGAILLVGARAEPRAPGRDTAVDRPMLIAESSRVAPWLHRTGDHEPPDDPMPVSRRLPVGAEVLPDGATHFRVWAPACRSVAVVLEGDASHALEPDGDGYFAVRVAGVGPGVRYRFRLDGNDPLYPDPASRFQPEGPHGPSQVVDPTAFPWTDADWKGVPLIGQVLYEMHVGTFTREGTWAAAARELPELAAAGITCLEVMPVADFPGTFGWGYDGVNLYAPTRLYGTPDDFRRFVDAAHKVGLGVILDVVYNHLGPDGNYLKPFAPAYFSDKYKTEWGEAINFDGPDSGPVREFFAGNAAYWIAEFHLDGLRLDATQNIYDDTPDPAKHILTEIGNRVQAAANGRATILVAENEPQDPNLVRPVDRGGFGLDAVWNDDFHHSAMVALTGRNEAYYTDYRGTPQEFISAAKYGYLYQGQWYSWQEKPRGHSGLDLAPAAFVTFTQNHDQVANSGRGLRTHQLTSPGRYRAMHALMLLAPGTPMLFQGQEFAAAAPFFYFADHGPDLAKLVQEGRAEFLSQFRSLSDPDMKPVFAAPHAAETFERCKLDFADRERNTAAYQLTKDLLRLRRDDPAFRAQARRGVDGAVLGDQAFALRYFADDGLDRLLLVNFGRDLHLSIAPEPLLAPPAQAKWVVALSTEDPKYGGCGTGPIETEAEGWRIAGESAAVLVPRPEPGRKPTRSAGRTGGGKRIVY